MQQLLWAVDLNLSYGDSMSMFTLVQFTTGGTLDTKSHYFDVPPPRKETKKSRRRKVKTEEEEVICYTEQWAVIPSTYTKG